MMETTQQQQQQEAATDITYSDGTPYPTHLPREERGRGGLLGGGGGVRALTLGAVVGGAVNCSQHCRPLGSSECGAPACKGGQGAGPPPPADSPVREEEWREMADGGAWGVAGEWRVERLTSLAARRVVLDPSWRVIAPRLPHDLAVLLRYAAARFLPPHPSLLPTTAPPHCHLLTAATWRGLGRHRGMSRPQEEMCDATIISTAQARADRRWWWWWWGGEVQCRRRWCGCRRSAWWCASPSPSGR
jgi:hypothetical protein